MGASVVVGAAVVGEGVVVIFTVVLLQPTLASAHAQWYPSGFKRHRSEQLLMALSVHGCVSAEKI